MMIDLTDVLSKMGTYDLKKIKALVDKELLSRGYGEPLILTEAEKDMIETDIVKSYCSRKLDVIRMVRNRTACMLKDAKAIVDDYYYQVMNNKENT